MSQALVLKFIELAEAEPNLRNQLETASSTKELQQIAASHGYDFTEQEIITVFQEQGILAVEEESSLSEEELEAVAGGVKFGVGVSFKVEF